ncbi:bordetella uptake domain-containing protein (plasmid) [Rhizobium gallicum]|uniref:Bordetella uptake domain-containing protein n=1 Tax=Rhizobium gallicum TaxID=56730 RepID=A0A1L5NS52_9HYPH|nr:tripartite tricarboxylate transporter substrate binding protein [Rhizobium gallicum]APO70731.1 bordetella uptake domain-containing protein [Rhizobium gallicum]
MHINRRACGFALAIIAFSLAIAAHAQQFPSKPITIVLGFSAGGATDSALRTVSEKASLILGTPIIFEYRPGANQTIAIRKLLEAKPDGYTLLGGTGSSLAQNPGMQKDLGYDPTKDFTPVASIGLGPGVLDVNSKLPIQSVAELIEYAKKNDGALNYGSGGFGTASHLAMEAFMAITGTKMIHVPLKSDTEVALEVSEGRIDVAFQTLQAVDAYVKSGAIRILAVTSVEEMQSAKGLPTLTATGVAGLDALDPYTFYGIVGPRGMPSETVNKLNEAFNKALADPDVRDRLQNILKVEPKPDTQEGFGSYVAEQLAKWRKLSQAVQISR